MNGYIDKFIDARQSSTLRSKIEIESKSSNKDGPKSGLGKARIEQSVIDWRRDPQNMGNTSLWKGHCPNRALAGILNEIKQPTCSSIPAIQLNLMPKSGKYRFHKQNWSQEKISMGYRSRGFCLVIILSLSSNVFVSSALNCVIKIDDQSLFEGTDLTLAGFYKIGEMARGVFILNSDGKYCERNVEIQREDISLFIKNETFVHAFYRLHGELYGKTFELVSNLGGRHWMEGELNLLNHARLLYPKNIFAQEKDRYYLYDDVQCVPLTKGLAEQCPCDEKAEESRCVYDVVTKSDYVVSPSVYNIIGCNEFSEVGGVLHVVQFNNSISMCKNENLQLVQLYDKKWTRSSEGCKELVIPGITSSTNAVVMTTVDTSSFATDSSTVALPTDDPSFSSMEIVSASSDPHVLPSGGSSPVETSPMQSASSIESKGSTVMFGSILGVVIFLALLIAVVVALVLTDRR
uniref:Uncharacterized protein n=1 Tax=Ditylenchus dipsaci TaxID=166011 RepID=A0A915CWP3_9BILA